MIHLDSPKRSLVGYGQMASKFFGNRNVIAGLIVAVVALAGLVGIMACLIAHSRGHLANRLRYLCHHCRCNPRSVFS